MRLTAGEPEDEPAIDRSEAQLAARGAPAQAAIAIEHPFKLGGGKIRIDDQPGAPGDFALVGAQPFANIRAAAALPDDRPAHRPSAGAFPKHKRLALIGDSDRADVGRPGARRAQRAPGQDHGRAENLLRVVFDPSRMRKELVNLAVGPAANISPRVHHQDGRSGRALVYRDNQFSHRRLLVNTTAVGRGCA